MSDKINENENNEEVAKQEPKVYKIEDYTPPVEEPKNEEKTHLYIGIGIAAALVVSIGLNISKNGKIEDEIKNFIDSSDNQDKITYSDVNCEGLGEVNCYIKDILIEDKSGSKLQLEEMVIKNVIDVKNIEDKDFKGKIEVGLELKNLKSGKDLSIMTSKQRRNYEEMVKVFGYDEINLGINAKIEKEGDKKFKTLCLEDVYFQLGGVKIESETKFKNINLNEGNIKNTIIKSSKTSLEIEDINEILYNVYKMEAEKSKRSVRMANRDLGIDSKDLASKEEVLPKMKEIIMNELQPSTNTKIEKEMIENFKNILNGEEKSISLSVKNKENLSVEEIVKDFQVAVMALMMGENKGFEDLINKFEFKVSK